VSASPFDHPFLSDLLGDEEVSALFSAQADIEAMISFEIALASAEAEAGVIPEEAGRAIGDALADFVPDMDVIRAGTANDGVVIPSLVATLRKAVGETYGSKVHFGATSQDVIDTSLALRLKKFSALIGARLDRVIALIEDLDARDGSVETMGHTRMQAAIPVPASRKIASWRDPLTRHREKLSDVTAEVAILTFGGAAGTLEKLGDRGAEVTRLLATRLDLRAVDRPRHSERDGVAAFASYLSLITGSLGKIGQDIALMAQNEVAEVKLAAGGGSSAMPHKVNPVGAETLVALARFNATLVAGLHQSLVHENERSGAAWTLEWMLLPQMAVATGAALRTAAALIPAVSFNRR